MSPRISLVSWNVAGRKGVFGEQAAAIARQERDRGAVRTAARLTDPEAR